MGELSESGLPRTYIGQSGSVGKRLEQHHLNKDFWNRAFIVISLTNSMTQTHALFLEWLAIAEATKDMSKMEQAIYAAGMFAAYDMWNDPMVMEGVANFLVDAEDTTGALAKLLPFIEDMWHWFKNMPPKERVAFLRSKAEAETEEVDPIYRYTYTPDSDWDSDAETLCEECGAQGHAKEDCIADQESYDDLYIANRAH
jgi:hypothetical protein